MTTSEAFKKLIEDPEKWKDAGFSDSTIRSWRKRLKDNKHVTKDAMEAALNKVAEKVRDEKWKFKKK